jgi:uncharacterized membrane-anchored protein YhcB (DUF1043 family)
MGKKVWKGEGMSILVGIFLGVLIMRLVFKAGKNLEKEMNEWDKKYNYFS